jgi:hypothetical protein
MGSAKSALMVATETAPAAPQAGKLGEQVAVVAPSRSACKEYVRVMVKVDAVSRFTSQ